MEPKQPTAFDPAPSVRPAATGAASEPLFDGAQLKLFHVAQAASDRPQLLVFGNERNVGRTMALRSGLVHPGEVDLFEIVPQSPNWYPQSEMAQICEVLGDYLGPRAMAFGTSMGGYGALRYGAQAGCAVTLALSPQADIAPDRAGPASGIYVRHYIEDVHGEMAPDVTDLAPSTIVAWDPAEAFDAHQAGLLPAPDGVRQVPMGYMGHWTGNAIDAAGGLAPVAVAALGGDVPEVARLLRRARRSWPMHLARLSLACGDANHPRWAFDIVNDAIDRFGSTPDLELALGSARVGLGAHEDGLETLERLIVSEPRNMRYWNALVAEYERLGHEGAAAEVLELATGQTEKFVYCWRLINKLMSLGAGDQARMIAELACELWPAKVGQLQRVLSRPVVA